MNRLLLIYPFLALNLMSSSAFYQTVFRVSSKQSKLLLSTQEASFQVFNGLKSEMFAHTNDISTVRQLSQIPLIESLARRLLTLVEEGFTVEQLSSSVLVGSSQMPRLNAAMLKASQILDIPSPDLYVKQSSIPNAYTLAFRGRKPFIVLTTGLLDLLNEQEILAVLGHELGHLKCEHTIWTSFLNFVVQLAGALGPFSPIRSQMLLWQRSAEFSSDRAALLVTKDTKIVASVLMKLCGGSNKNEYTRELNVDAFLEQAKKLENEAKTFGGDFYLSNYDRFATHPLPLIRAIELIRWSKSPQYQGLLNRATSAELRE